MPVNSERPGGVYKEPAGYVTRATHFFHKNINLRILSYM